MRLPNVYARCTGDIVSDGCESLADATQCEKRERCLRYKDKGSGVVVIMMGRSDCDVFIGVTE